jgi:hypothetical protein
MFPLIKESAKATETGRLSFRRLCEWKAPEIGFEIGGKLFHALEALG